MDLITGLFDLDFASLMPEMGALLSAIQPILSAVLLAAPLIMLVLGTLYLFLAPPEANYKFGHRTHFGMGSVEAWRFTQKVAGLAYCGIGVILLIAMVIVIFSFAGKDFFQMAETAITCLLWQVGIVLLAQLVIAVVVGVFFTASGERRRE